MTSELYNVASEGVNVRSASIKVSWVVARITLLLSDASILSRQYPVCDMFGRLVLILLGAVSLASATAPSICTIPATVREG